MTAGAVVGEGEGEGDGEGVRLGRGRGVLLAGGVAAGEVGGAGLRPAVAGCLAAVRRGWRSLARSLAVVRGVAEPEGRALQAIRPQ